MFRKAHVRLDGKDFDDLPEASIYQCDADRRGKAKTIVLDIEVGDGCLERRMSTSRVLSIGQQGGQGKKGVNSEVQSVCSEMDN